MKAIETLINVDLYEFKIEAQKLLDNGYDLHTFTIANHGAFVGVFIKEKKEKTKRVSTADKLIEEALDGVDFNCLEKQLQWAKDFIEYRRKIKKPIKTANPLKMYLRELDKICEHGYDVAEAVELMKEREWQTLKLDYIHNKKDNCENQFM